MITYCGRAPAISKWIVSQVAVCCYPSYQDNKLPADKSQWTKTINGIIRAPSRLWRFAKAKIDWGTSIH